MTDRLPVILAILGLLVFIGLGALLLMSLGRSRGRHASPKRPTRSSFRRDHPDEPAPRKRVGVVLNPTKFDDPVAAKAIIAAAVGQHEEWDAPDIRETTVEDPGDGLARAFLAEDVDLICAVGGDGTVRSVAQALAGSATPMGLIPAGTGNLMGRNLDLPLDDLGAGVEVALTGRNRHVDVGWVRLDPPRELLDEIRGEVPEETRDPDAPSLLDSNDWSEGFAFLVMSGLGLDASIMHSTSESAKARIGWGAYVASGAKNILGARFTTRLRIDGGAPISHTARTVVVGNCGRLTGGITLMPDAEVDDGILDVVAITPKGLVGWAGVAVHVLAKRGRNHPKLDRYRCQTLLVSLDETQMVEVDGDVIGEARRAYFEVRPKALIVRTTSAGAALDG